MAWYNLGTVGLHTARVCSSSKGHVVYVCSVLYLQTNLLRSLHAEEVYMVWSLGRLLKRESKYNASFFAQYVKKNIANE
jgi:hypothetical protein